MIRFLVITKEKKFFLLKSYHHLFACSLLIYTAAVIVSCKSITKLNDMNNQSNATLQPAIIAKNTIISLLEEATKIRMLEERSSTSIERVNILFDIIGDQLLIFNSLNSHNDLETLVSLYSYNLGTHNSEIFSCVILKKGSKIKPYLEKMRIEKRNECLEKFGGYFVMNKNMCYTNEEITTRIEAHIHFIILNEKCDFE